MKDKRKIEIFSAGCFLCDDVIDLVNRIACPSCDVSVLDMKDENVVNRAKSMGIHSVPAVAVDGKLAECCAGKGPDETTLRRMGLGQPV